MTKYCCQQPGILLYHKVGTGKTLTALSVLRVYAKAGRKCVAFAPPELMFMWQEEAGRTGLSDLSIHPLADMATLDVRGAAVVVDEVHFWLEWLHSSDAGKRQRATSAYRNLQNAFRRILLTGSPINDARRGLFDIAVLVNLAAGRQVFTFSYPDFKAKYTKVDESVRVWWGWVAPLAMTVGNHIVGVKASIFMGKLLSWMSNKFSKGGDFAALFPRVFAQLYAISLFTSLTYKQCLGLTMADAKRFFTDAGPYCSFYDAKLNASSYPSYRVHEEVCELSQEQSLLWLEIANQLNSATDLRGMAITSDGIELAHEAFMATLDSYQHQARRVGIFTSSPKASPPAKYLRVLQCMASCNYKQCVVYSDLQGGMKPFSDFLTSKGIQWQLLTGASTPAEKRAMLDGFQACTVPVLLLAPEIYYGITIKGARQLHLLEPVSSVMVRTQLYGRVIRYQSHSHLPPAERHVDIFVHIADLPQGLDAMLKMTIVKWMFYLKHDSGLFPGMADTLRKMKHASFGAYMAPDRVAQHMADTVESAMPQGGSSSKLVCPPDLQCQQVAAACSSTQSARNARLGRGAE